MATSVANVNALKHSQLTSMVITCGTKVTKALIGKCWRALKPDDKDSSEWTLDSFLEQHKKEILNNRLGRDYEWLYFPLDKSYNPIPTVFDKWDINQTIFILLLTCKLESTMRMYLDQLRNLRNKLAHMSSQDIEASKFEHQVTKVTTILGHCLLEVGDDQLTNEIHDLFHHIEAGTIFQNVEQQTEQTNTRASLGKMGDFGDG